MAVPGAQVKPVRRTERICGADLHYWLYHADLAQPSGTVVMVHGLRGTHEGLELIARQLTDHRVLVPDLPAFGESSPMTDRRHDAAGYGSAVVELLNRCGARERPVVLVGHSFGSVVAAHAASRVPDWVQRLALINPIATPPLRGLSVMASAYYWLGQALPPRWGNNLLSHRWIVLAMSRAMVRAKDERTRRFVHDSHLRHFSRFHSPALLYESFASSIRDTVTEYAPSLTMPTLLIAGATDTIAPLSGQRALAERLTRAELVVLPKVGHLVHYEAPVAAAGAIRRFLEAS